MAEILILYLLLKGQNTMYGLSKSLIKFFGMLTNPGFGTLQPALKRLEKKNFIKSDKFITDGGKPYYYYSITDPGKEFLESELMNKISSNPVQMVPSVKIRLICSEILDTAKRKSLCIALKTEVLKVANIAEKALKNEIFDTDYAGKMVLDNTLCEYKNLYNLIEGIEKCLQ
ncbi:MAG: PadR family transcriptional regulator [Cyanobacteria bacterium RUI128]|nr:PadR family transcriptional regulator [Cyanobacteria bacterium RUI128]